MTETRPSRHAANNIPVLGSYALPSGSPPIGGDETTLPVSAFVTTITLSQAENRRRFFKSIARAEGPSQGARGQDPLTASDLVSNSVRELLSSIFTNMLPLPSRAGSSGLPPRATVPTTFPDVASITVESLLFPLKVKTRLVAGS